LFAACFDRSENDDWIGLLGGCGRPVKSAAPRAVRGGVERQMAIEGYDLVMLGILAAAAVLGYFKGLVWQIAWIAGIAASSYVAIRFGGPLAPFFGQQAPWNKLIAMLALYVATSLAVWLVFRVVSGAINAIHLSAFDHQLGLLLGLAKGALLCVVITFFAVTLAPGYRDQIVASRSGRIVAELIVRADQYLPKDVVETVDPFVKQFEDQLRRPPGAPPAAAAAAGPSPLQAIWEGVTSAAAWTGAEQGGQVGQGGASAGGVVPAAGGWGVPAPPAAGWPAAPVPQPRPTASGFAPPPAQPERYPQMQPGGPPAPQRFPVGAQTPLPIR
jgi:membrane protein required for colicin V production